MIKNIVFDLGGVLLNFDPLEYMEYMGFTREEGTILRDIIWKSNEWHLADLGVIDYQELIDGIVKSNPKYAKELKYVLDNKDNNYILHQNEINFNYLKELKMQGYRIYFISNVTSFDLEFNRNNFEIFKLIDGAIYSCEIGVTKPDLECYKALIDKYNLDVRETVFIDDLLENCLAALDMKIKAIRYTDEANLRRLLTELIRVNSNTHKKIKSRK